MIVKYIDNSYIIDDLGKTSWGDVEEPDFYIKMASERVKRLIFPSEQGDPNDISTYTEEQQAAIKLATAKYTFWYFDTNYDQTSGSVSVSFGGVSMSESKSYNGETVLPEVYDILQQANLIPTTETFAILNTPYQQDWNKPDEFKKLQQELEVQTNNNIRQDNEIRELQDKINSGFEYNGISPIIVDNISRLISIDITEFNKQNTEVFTKSEVLNVVYASGSQWRPDFPYKTDYITQRVTEDNKLLYFLALKDSLGVDPLEDINNEYWQKLETQDIDLNVIIEQLKPYIDQQLPPLVEAEVKTQLDNLPESDYTQETKYQEFEFFDEQHFQNYNLAAGITGQENEYWKDDPRQTAFTNVEQTFTENQIYNANVAFNKHITVPTPASRNNPATKEYVDELTKINAYHKYLATIPLNKDTLLDMSNFFIQDGQMRQGEFQFVMRDLGSNSIAYSWNHVHYVGLFSTVGANFEFTFPRNSAGRWSFYLRQDGQMRIWTNSSAVDNNNKIEIMVRQVGRLI